MNELKRHVYANSVDRPTVRKILRRIFQPCKCNSIAKLKGNTETSVKACSGHEVSFSIDNTVLDLDLPKENITTLLCYLELDERKWVEILPLTYETCKIQSYSGSKLFKVAASRVSLHSRCGYNASQSCEFHFNFHFLCVHSLVSTFSSCNCVTERKGELY